MVHDDTFIVPDPPQEPIHPAAMPKPPAPIATDVDMPRHAVVQYVFNSLLVIFLCHASNNYFFSML